MADYKAMLKGLQLRHISPREVTSYAGQVRKGVKNSLPPRALEKNIIPTLWIVDHLRALLGKPVRLTSIYRSPAYNGAVGGARFSQHKENRAIDLQVDGVSPRRVANALVKLRQAGMFKGGIGLYSTFVHVDTRGSNATWGM